MDALAELVRSAESLAVNEEDQPSLRDPHIIRALVARKDITLLPGEAARRWQTMFPADRDNLGRAPDHPIPIAPRARAVLFRAEDDPVATVTRRILADNHSGETMALFAVARIKQVQITNGPVLENTYIELDSWTVLDSETGDLVVRHRDPNAVTSLARSYGLDD
ncbi:hypothetical protein [Arthrobacter cryoconiti]|uniref:Uncharacterized protein n=1 Tax=Arthrobacter cryoconiti TaxID=748907 RepID=A0ABV8QVJ3_9MICC|nr:hypothetical protein [Arthrobacter cryoconiti]MCC9069553.1 hypothetical protein [Arthrobacter cryoconiti]